ncbi:MAG: PorP/SprF family type IX secretion system membrane protein [Bacteroidales bacterium]|nr:PorP/SprF family type IX secretion system membrane protein [Bacteroidales bacterium]
MKKYLAIIFILNLAILSSCTYAQDIHFSKFFSAPLILNPANTTNYHGNWSLISNYRSQGAEIGNAYITSTVAFDFPVYINKERAGLGFIWINDKSSNNSIFVNKLFLSSAYFIRISHRSYLHMGLQAGYVSKKIDYSNITFPDQFDMSIGYFNPDIPSIEILQNESISYLDLNWGLIWSYKTQKFTSEIGMSMFHYNKPVESFSSADYRLNPRYVFHAFTEKAFLNNYFIKPKLIYVNQNKASELLIGFDTGLLFFDNKISKNAYIGTFFRGGLKRNPDAFIVKTGFNYKNFDFAISYDIEIPGYEFYSYTKSSFELSISYKRPETNIKNKTIPCTVF